MITAPPQPWWRRPVHRSPPGARRWLRTALACVGALVALAPARADAHDVRPGVVALEAHEPGRYTLHVEPPVDAEGATSPLRVDFPAGCVETDGVVDCDGEAMRGTLTVDGLETAAVRVVVHVVHADGASEQHLLAANTRSAAIGQSQSRGVLPWIVIGIEHILAGIDHLAFVFALLLVGGFDRRLPLTLTAFTIGHSLTLALNVFDIIPSSSKAVESIIAASVLFLAVEAARHRVDASRPEADRSNSPLGHHPWLVAGGFGLVHGLGFASALRELHLPASRTAVALFGFNVGVELGQFLFVGGCALLLAVARLSPGRLARWIAAPPTRTVAIYVLGSVAAWWTFARLTDFVLTVSPAVSPALTAPW